MQNKRNGEIDLFRFIFSMFIVLLHFFNFFHIELFIRGGICVEFFFVVSGYLMASHVSRMQERPSSWDAIADSTWGFIIRKIGSFFHYYVSAIILSLLIRDILIKHTALSTVIKRILASVPTFTLTFMGLNYNSVSLYVGGTWYLSCMIIVMFMLYPLLLKSFNFSTKVIFPLMAMFLLAYTYNTDGTITNWNTWNGFVYSGILRAAAEIALGSSLFPLVCFLRRKYDLSSGNSVPVKAAVTAVKAGCYLFFILYAYGVPIEKGFTLHVLIWCALGIALSFSGIGYTIPDCRLTRYLGKISLPIFIYHNFLLYTCSAITGDIALPVKACLLIVGICVLLCLFFMYAMDFILRRAKLLMAKGAK